MTNAKQSPAKMLLLGFQHVFAMFGATVLVPTLTGLSVSATLLFAGLGREQPGQRVQRRPG